MVYGIVLGALLALFVAFYPLLRGIMAGIMIRRSALRPGDLIEYQYDFAWLRKVGLYYTSLDARAGGRIFIPNPMFISWGIHRYEQCRIIQRLPVVVFPDLTTDIVQATLQTRAEVISPANASIGTVEIDANRTPVLKTDIWMVADGNGQGHIKRALLDEVLIRAESSGLASSLDHSGNATMH